MKNRKGYKPVIHHRLSPNIAALAIVGLPIAAASGIARAAVPSPHADAAAVTDLQRTPIGFTVHTNGGLLQVQAWANRVIRVRFVHSTTIPKHKSLTVIAKPTSEHVKAISAPGFVGIRTSAIEARVDIHTGAVSFVDVATGKPFLSETANGRQITTATIAGKAVHGPSQSFELSRGEAIFGLGQHQQGVMNYVGHTVHLQQENTKIAIPVLMSSAGYVLLWDNPSITDVDVAKTHRGVVRWSFQANVTDYYVCYGPNLDKAIGEYRWLTGPVPMFGKWAWGFWQSRERYESQKQILGVASEYRRRQLPIDNIIQDWHYWSPFPWGSHRFGPAYPDPAGLMRQLHDEHFHAIISVWGRFVAGSKNYDELNKAGFLYPHIHPNDARYYDAFNPSARRMYWRQIKDEIAKFGWDGWWLDATEPDLDGHWGEFSTLPTFFRPGYKVYNGYPLETTTAVYKGQRDLTSAKRSFILTRSAYAVQQRNAAVSWSGDTSGTWTVFQHQITAGLNFVASGVPYWNTDIGGYWGGNHDSPAYRELFTRWYQFGAFCPMFRVHGTGSHKEMWLFGPKVLKVLLRYDDLRYRLLPYIYSVSWNVTHNGGTMMRPLVMDFRHDPAVYGIADQFMFGPDLMVCPVTHPIGGTLSIVPSQNLIDQNGQPGGLLATYFQGEDFNKEVVHRKDSAIDFNWDKVKREGVGANPRTDPIPGLNMDHFSARWTGFIQTHRAGNYKFQLQADDGMRMWIDGKQVIDDWKARPAETKTATVKLPAETRVPIKIEYFQNVGDAIIDLRWQPPSAASSKVFTQKVYLPPGDWRDFWTGKSFTGGQTIAAPAAIETMPLYVRAGSILPMGPMVQYALQQPNAPLELRIYRGQNGAFTHYDDAGDGYGYEHGQLATIPVSWNQSAGVLTIGARSGRYPGMAAHRQFNIVWVDVNHGGGLAETSKPDEVIEYDGSPVRVHVPEGSATSSSH